MQTRPAEPDRSAPVGSSVVVLGGGLSGVATAYTLALAGYHDITVVERGDSLGGLAGSFEQDGNFYPLGYHHILHRDQPLLFFLDRIDALRDVRWRKVRMLFHRDDHLYALGTPSGFLRFPMAPLDKLRFARLMLRAFGKRDWSEWIGRSAAELVDAWAGPGVRRALFEDLCRIRFELPCDDVSAAWLGRRLYYREGSAPLGYIPGTNWTKVLCDGVTRLIGDMGVEIRLGTSVERLHGGDGRILEVELAGGERIAADLVVSSVPTEAYGRMNPEDHAPELADVGYSALISTIVVTRQRVEPDFYWMSLLSPGSTASGIFRLDSLNPSIGRPGDACLNFVTHLRGRDRDLFGASDEKLLERYLADFRSVFGFELDPHWVKISRVPMYSPILSPSYRNPPIRSGSWRNLYFAGNYRTFPSVVSTGTALRSGVETARAILDDHGSSSPLLEQIDAFALGSMPGG